MSQILSLLRAARTSPDTASGLASRHLLTELLGLHESMIIQLRLELLERAGSSDFIPRLIEQHEKAAAMLRDQLAPHAVRMPGEIPPVASGSFPPTNLPVKSAG